MDTHPHTNPQDRPLSELESILVVEWLRGKGYPVTRLKALARLRPSDISKSFHIKIDDILSAARRDNTE